MSRWYWVTDLKKWTCVIETLFSFSAFRLTISALWLTHLPYHEQPSIFFLTILTPATTTQSWHRKSNLDTWPYWRRDFGGQLSIRVTYMVLTTRFQALVLKDLQGSPAPYVHLLTWIEWICWHDIQLSRVLVCMLYPATEHELVSVHVVCPQTDPRSGTMSWRLLANMAWETSVRCGGCC